MGSRDSLSAFGLQLGLHFRFGDPERFFGRLTAHAAFRVPNLDLLLCQAKLLRHRKQCLIDRFSVVSFGKAFRQSAQFYHACNVISPKIFRALSNEDR